MLNKENNPWLGLASYEYEDAYRFFGREKELAGLKDAVCNNLITTIYGISGAGKTSLINAGMCPLLEKGEYLPIRIRLEHCSEKTYSEQIIAAVQNAISKVNGEIENSTEIETKKTTDDGKEINLIPEEEKLWLFFHTSLFWSETNHQICPVIFIDQFEEIFTKNKNTDVVHEFFNCINSLQYDVPPAATIKLLEEQKDYTDLNITKDFRFVFIMREDFLARLEDYAYDIPALRKNRIGIKRMNGLQALEVILRPMPEIVSKEVALKIIDKVSGCPVKDNPSYLEHLSIDTSILSLFCSELYFKAAEQKQDSITQELIEHFGENILFSFYDNTMKLVSSRTMEYLETHLLTRSGFRNAVALEDMLDAGIKKEELDKLSAKRLIRIETANGTERVEYTHDVLCAIAKEHRDKRIDKNSRKSSIYRNVGFIFDSFLAFVAVFDLLFTLYTEGRIHYIIGLTTINIVLQASIFFTLTFPLFVLSYRHTKERNAIWTSLITLIVNYLTMMLILTIGNLSPSDFASPFLIINAIYPLFQFLNAFRFNKKQNLKETTRYIYKLKIYSDYPFFKKVLKIGGLATIIYISFLVGLSLNVPCSYISIPICSLLGLLFLAEFTNVSVKFDWNSIAIYIITILLLLVLITAQFYHYRIFIMLLIWVLLLGTTFYYVSKNAEKCTWKKKTGVTFLIWGISMLFIPSISIGYNVFNYIDYVRTPNGTINNYQIARYLIIEDENHQKGVRDRWDIIIPTEYDSIEKRVFINIYSYKLSGLMAYDNFYKRYLDRDYKAYYSDIDSVLYNDNEDDNSNYEIVFKTIKGNQKSYWLCSDHLDLDNSCTDILVSCLKHAYSIEGKTKYLRYLYAKEYDNYPDFDQRLCECFTYKLKEKEKKRIFQYFKFIESELDSAKQDSLWEQYQYFCNNMYDEDRYLDNLKRGKEFISYGEFAEMLSSNIELLALNRYKKVSQLLLDSIYPQSTNVIDSCEYFINLSYYKLFARDFKGAESAAKHAIAKDSSQIIAYTNLFTSLYLQNEFDKAFPILEKYKNVKIMADSTNNTYKYFGDGIWEDFSDLIEYGVYTEVQSEHYKNLKSILQDYVGKPRYDYAQSWLGKEIRTRLDKNGDKDYWYLTSQNKVLTPRLSGYHWHKDNNDSIVWFKSYDTQKSGYYGYSGESEFTIPASFDHSWIFSEGLAVVEKDGKLGFIDKKGNYVLKPMFEYSRDKVDFADYVDFVFHDGFCPMVAAPGKHGLVDAKGKWVLEPEYSYVNNPVNEYRIVRLKDKYGLLNSNLEWVLPIQYAWISQDQEDNTITINNNTYTYPQFKKMIRNGLIQ